MKRIYYLKTCDTCRRILKSIQTDGFELINIKETPIGESDLDTLKQRVGSYKSLFSKRSQSYKKLGLKDKVLSEGDIKSLILSDYTFLKRPVIIDGDALFIGSDKKNLDALNQHLAI